MAQSSEINLSTFKRIENEWGRALDEGRNVSVEIEVIYQGNNTRPSSFNIKYSIDGRQFNRTLNN